MATGVTLWIRPGQRESDDAVAFLKAHRYGADATRDVDRMPPDAGEVERLKRGLGGDDAVLWESPGRLKAPLLLTPRGTLVGFRERRWRDFLDIGKGR